VRLFFVIIISIALQGCLSDVPHTNPIDPLNPQKGYTLNGMVTSLYDPVQPLANCLLILHPGDQRTFSDENGRFVFENLSPDTYALTATRARYQSDSLTFSLTGDQTINIRLDGLPQFETIGITTHHTSQFFPVDDLYYVALHTSVNDPDGLSDISRVLVDIPEYSFTDTLQITPTPGVYTLRVNVEDLPVNTVQNLIGRALYFRVYDQPGAVIRSTPRYLTRVIETTPVPTEPTGLSTVPGDTITFRWQPLSLPYDFSLKIQLYQINQGVLFFINEINVGAPLGNSSKQENTLPAGDYVWRLMIVDEFGNTSLSKESTFKVN